MIIAPKSQQVNRPYSIYLHKIQLLHDKEGQ